MFGVWLLMLPLLVEFNKVFSQPITSEGIALQSRQLEPRDCCPCPESAQTGLGTIARSTWSDGPRDCSCHPLTDDAEGSASILSPALRAIQPFVRQADQKTEPKPLLQPEVGLASSVLETLRQATDEEYQDALARDAARSAVKFIETSLDSSDDVLTEPPKNIVRIFLNTQPDDMDDNLPEPSHIQETRCIHSPLESVHNGQLRISRPTPIVEFLDLSRKPTRKQKNKSLLHRNIHDMDSEIGASDIQQRVIAHNLEEKLKSNPALVRKFTHNNLETTDNIFQKNVSDESSPSSKIKPKIHLKLKELIDNLERNSIKGKPNVPIIDLKNLLPTTTRTPPFKLKSIQESVYNNRFLKNLLKLKDVEIIPQTDLIKNITEGKSSYPNLKLRSNNSNLKKTNTDIDNCKDNRILMPVMNNNIKMNPIHDEIPDTVISPTNSNPVFDLKSDEGYMKATQNIIPIDCTPSSETSKSTSISSPTDFETQYYSDYDDINIEKDFNVKRLLPDNCNGDTENHTTQLVTNKENQKNDRDNNGLEQKEKVQELEGNGDILNDYSNNYDFQMDLLNDLDTPIQFDNSSFIPESELKDNDIIQYDMSVDENQSTLNDPVADTSINNIQIIRKISDESPKKFQSNLKNTDDKCILQEKNSKKSDVVSIDLASRAINQKTNPIQQESSEGGENLPINDACDNLPNINKVSNQLSFKDLQDMSNNILSISEREPLRQQSVNTKSNMNGLDEKNKDCDITNTDLSTHVLVTNSEKPQTEDYPLIETILDANSDENLCKSSLADVVAYNISEYEIKNSINPDLEISEMEAEASESDSMSITNAKLRETFINDNTSKIFTKPNIKDILKANIHSDIINNLKSKFEGLFSTTEKVISRDILNIPDDNINESSNINHMVAKFDKLNNFTPLKLPEMSLSPYKNKLTVPSYIDQRTSSNLHKLLKFPLDVSKPLEDTLDPSLAFSALSDKLRSHTENTIQNVKETLESSLKDSQVFRVSEPSNTIDPDDLLHSISNRRDEMKEKLEAIHSDLSDRFSLFQKNILDHFNLPSSSVDSELQEDSSNGRLRKVISLPEATKFWNAKDDHNFLSHMYVSNSPKNTDISLKSPKGSVASLQNPILYSTTAIPSFIPRPKVLKTNIQSIPRLISESPRTRTAKIPTLSEEKVTKMKPLLLKTGPSSKISTEPYSAPSYRSSSGTKPLQINTKNINKDDLSIEYPVNKLSKTFLQSQKFKSDAPRRHHRLNNLLDSDGHSSTKQESRLSRPRFGSKHNDDRIISPTPPLNSIHSALTENELTMVEPLIENVPYKCKLICYKDS